MKKIDYFYDKEADVFYFSQGTPRASDTVVETGNDTILRLDPKTKKVRGFTLLNASVRTRGRNASLPFSFEPVQ